MLIYYLTIFFLTGTGIFFQKKGKHFTIPYLAVSFLTLLFLASFRYAIGFDYFSYRNIYQSTAHSSIKTIFSSHWREPLFYLLCKISTQFGFSYPIFLWIVQALFLLIIMRFIYRYSHFPWISIYLFITLQFFAYSMNLIRQSISVSFFLLAYPYLKNRKIMPYTLFILLGGLFHNSLFLIWPFYFLLPKQLSWKSFLFLCTIIIFSYFFFDPLFALIMPHLTKRYSSYVNSYYWQPNNFSYIILPAIYLFFVALFKNNITNPTLRSIYLNSAIYQFFITLFITKHFILERFAIYPFALSLITIPEILFSCKKEKKHYILLLFLLFGAAYFCFAAIKGFHGVYPYISLLKKSCTLPN